MNKFDKTLNKLNLNTENVGYWQPYQIQLITDVIEDLRQEYAPTVEMTKAQFDQVEYAKKNLTASQLPRVIHKQPEGDWSYLDELSGHLFKHQQGGMTDKNIEDIMQVWLHPETIKVVDE